MTETTEAAPAPAKAARQTRFVALGVIGFILLLIVLNMVGSRLTPYTSQARVHAYVVPVAPEVGGTIEKVHVVNNQTVRKGQPLFTLGADSFRIAAEKARADIAATLREQQAQDAAIVGAVANRQIAEAELLKARQDTSRLERIWSEDKGAISIRRLEISRATLTEAQSRVTAATAQIAQARAARGLLDAGNDRLVAARSALAKADLDIRKTTVVAPADGLITDLKTDVGQFAGPGNPVMTFISLTDVWITADMTENNIGRLQRGAPVEIVLDVLPGEVIKGRVRSIGYGVGRQQQIAAGDAADDPEQPRLPARRPAFSGHRRVRRAGPDPAHQPARRRPGVGHRL